MRSPLSWARGMPEDDKRSRTEDRLSEFAAACRSPEEPYLRSNHAQNSCISDGVDGLDCRIKSDKMMKWGYIKTPPQARCSLLSVPITADNVPLSVRCALPLFPFKGSASQ